MGFISSSMPALAIAAVTTEEWIFVLSKNRGTQQRGITSLISATFETLTRAMGITNTGDGLNFKSDTWCHNQCSVYRGKTAEPFVEVLS